MRWPWSKPSEVRESQPFTDAVLTALAAGVSGTGAKASATAALEAASGVVARGLAAARVENAPAAVEVALTPGTLALIGRDLIRRGESIHLIEVSRGGLSLRPVGSWDVRGGPDPASWYVRADIFGPSGNLTRFVPHSATVHCRYSVDASRPWHGIGPLGWAALSGALHAGTVAALGRDMKAAGGYVLPMPPAEADDDDSGSLGGLKGVLAKLSGKTAFVESTRGAFGGDVRDAPAQDWVQKRLGPAPDQTLASLHDTTATAVLAACGVDPVLVGLSKGDGTLAREAYRRFERLTLQPLARVVEGELRDKLDAPDLTLNFDSLRSSDFAGIARAFKALVETGVTPDTAGALLDLDL